MKKILVGVKGDFSWPIAVYKYEVLETKEFDFKLTSGDYINGNKIEKVNFISNDEAEVII